MMRSPRPRTNLPDSVHRQLNMYALAAGAAGVGALALAQSAEAKIVYTPAEKWLPVNHRLYLDLNHDHVNDFRFSLFSASWSSAFSKGFVHSLAVERAKTHQSQNNVYSAGNRQYLCAAALPKGAKIGPDSPFTPPFNGPWMFLKGSRNSGRSSACPWLGVQGQAYLGLEFAIGGRVHYGWARFGFISPNRPVKAKLTGYAYETIPGKAIIAGATRDADEEPTASFNTRTPEPATLAMLALGAPGLSIWRREESAFAAPRPNKS